MKSLDRILQGWRIAKAAPWVRAGDRLLDIGCYDRSLIDRVHERVASAVGIDVLTEGADDEKVRIVQGSFPDDLAAPPESFDCITALAVFEHVEDPRAFARACHRLLSPGGRTVLTVPHPAVDAILAGLIRLRVADGMAEEQHHGFDVTATPSFFELEGLSLRAATRFQLGLNRLFVFEKAA
ncbi:MAG: hypothetical protein CL910_20880 [Deltaproteobacteria bacterium]|nr:hypothetical protein [Deltaproteobacteria bacterium]